MPENGRGSFHDKFALFDDKVLETGSFNWTANGKKYNHENVIFFTDPKLIKAFRQEFEKLWKEGWQQAETDSLHSCRSERASRYGNHLPLEWHRIRMV